MMLCSAVLAVLLLLAPLKPSHSRSLHTPDRAMQVIEQFLERYNDLLTLDDLDNLTSDQSEEPVQVFNSGIKVAENPKWIDIPVQNENSWVRLLKGALANQKRALSDRSRRGWNRGCFGLKLDRIGSMSGLGC
ncbi:C-type natriuretic peptide-like precursor [Ictalurus punctatus]|uniref:C-type natriuretic peptide 1 n=1 Tax=Ictalurus punctatus TaxID=7998 RepID=E3TEX7_ICTPU|nr:C-type natriuretic peptide-like precursor [Ictalurus punctatus]XP_053486053.1 C-type natriuretic peptide-like [Ictalurus furcatus]XP_053486060.1 C-type natriuretic peptide-like [Ictalurus furcatus]XP_053486065.1 C-type natriuretic peptide-like [Ictalurus furcatus]XP_053486071.1 C-type natriuretic peptide-like [Ictalurus furcatus]ADO28863.1 c-type natriuretic peptide 1 [Ictalurus punctatus]